MLNILFVNMTQTAGTPEQFNAADKSAEALKNQQEQQKPQVEKIEEKPGGIDINEGIGKALESLGPKSMEGVSDMMNKAIDSIKDFRDILAAFGFGHLIEKWGRSANFLKYNSKLLQAMQERDKELGRDKTETNTDNKKEQSAKISMYHREPEWEDHLKVLGDGTEIDPEKAFQMLVLDLGFDENMHEHMSTKMGDGDKKTVIEYVINWKAIGNNTFVKKVSDELTLYRFMPDKTVTSVQINGEKYVRVGTAPENYKFVREAHKNNPDAKEPPMQQIEHFIVLDTDTSLSSLTEATGDEYEEVSDLDHFIDPSKLNIDANLRTTYDANCANFVSAALNMQARKDVIWKANPKENGKVTPYLKGPDEKLYDVTYVPELSDYLLKFCNAKLDTDPASVYEKLKDPKPGTIVLFKGSYFNLRNSETGGYIEDYRGCDHIGVIGDDKQFYDYGKSSRRKNVFGNIAELAKPNVRAARDQYLRKFLQGGNSARHVFGLIELSPTPMKKRIKKSPETSQLSPDVAMAKEEVLKIKPGIKTSVRKFPVSKDSIINIAKACIGTPYKFWGRSCESLDCLGLISMIWQLTDFRKKDGSKLTMNDFSKDGRTIIRDLLGSGHSIKINSLDDFNKIPEGSPISFGTSHLGVMSNSYVTVNGKKRRKILNAAGRPLYKNGKPIPYTGVGEVRDQAPQPKAIGMTITYITPEELAANG